jgi:hypothetical protein
VKAITAANAEAAHSVSRASAQAAHDAAIPDAIEDWQLSSRESLTDLLFTEGQSRETYNVATSNVYANWENGVGNLLGDKPEGTGWEDGMNLGGDKNNQPHGPNNTPGNGFAAFVVWTPHEPEPPKKPQPIPPPPQQPHADDNIFSSPERPSIEKLQFLYDHFGKDCAEELIEIRWPSKPDPESKYSMSAYQPSAEELLAQRLPGYWRLRELIELSEAGALNGRGRDEMKALAAEFNFHWSMANGSDGGLFSTLNMWAGLTVAGQNPTMNQLMSSLSSMAAVRPTPVRPNLRLEIKPRYTQQPLTGHFYAPADNC